MQFSQDQDLNSYTIRAYGAGHVDIVIPARTNEAGPQSERLTDSFVMTPDVLIREWEPDHPDELHVEHFEVVLELQPEVVLLGTGRRLEFPDMALMAGFMEQGIGFEVMDTAAACRTYNILMNEGRRVAAAILQ